MLFDTSERVKPVLKWAGGKSGLLDQLIPHFPHTFERYFEPFLGGAAVFLSLHPKVPAVLNELNAELFNLYCVIRDQPDALICVLDELRSNYSEEFYYQLRREQPRERVRCAARTLFLNKTGFNGLYRQNKRGDFNVPFGHNSRCPAIYSAENISLVSERLRKAILLNLDFAELLAQAGEGDFVYCDPPYEPMSSTASFNTYTRFGFTRDDQIRLKKACAAAVERGAIVAISNSSAPFIQELYSDVRTHAIRARRSINSDARKRGAVNELLILMEQ